MASASVVLSALAKSPGSGKRLEPIPWLHFGRSYSTVVPVWPNLQSLFMHWNFGHCLRIQLPSSFVKQLFTAVQNDSHHVPAVFKDSMAFFYSTLHCKLTGYSKFWLAPLPTLWFTLWHFCNHSNPWCFRQSCRRLKHFVLPVACGIS